MNSNQHKQIKNRTDKETQSNHNDEDSRKYVPAAGGAHIFNSIDNSTGTSHECRKHHRNDELEEEHEEEYHEVEGAVTSEGLVGRSKPTNERHWSKDNNVEKGKKELH